MWRETLKIGPWFQVFLANFLLRMCRNDQNSNTSGQIFNTKFETAMGCFLFDYELLGRLLQALCSFKRKNSFVMHNFWNLEATGSVGDLFLTKRPKRTSLADFMHFEPLCMQIRSRAFPLGEPTNKRDTTKSHRDIIFHLFAANSPLNQI